MIFFFEQRGGLLKVCERLLKEYLQDHSLLVSLPGIGMKNGKLGMLLEWTDYKTLLSGNVKLLLCHSLCSFFFA